MAVSGKMRNFAVKTEKSLMDKNNTDIDLSKAFAKLDHLALLKENWDGRGALPVSRRVLNNIKSVLSISDDEDF